MMLLPRYFTGAAVSRLDSRTKSTAASGQTEQNEIVT